MRYDPKPYELKILELRGRIESEAKELQNVQEAKDSSLLDVKNLAERKSRLKNESDKLERQIENKKDVLNKFIEKKRAFVASVTQDLKNEKERLQVIQSILGKTTQDLENLTNVANELQGFINASSKVREMYNKEVVKLGKARVAYQKTSSLTAKEKEEAKQEKQEADEMKEYVKDLYGKLATYTKVAQETLEYVNEHLEKTGTPIKFEVPVELNLNNFNEQT